MPTTQPHCPLRRALRQSAQRSASRMSAVRYFTYWRDDQLIRDYRSFLCCIFSGEEKNLLQAYDNYKKGCDYKFMPACHNLAMMYGGGKISHKKDFKSAAKYFEQACKGQNHMSCYHLAGLYISGKGEIEKDMEKAFKYSKMACDGGIMYACSNMSQMYAKGEGVDKNKMLADKYKKMAVEMQASVKEAHRTLTFGQ